MTKRRINKQQSSRIAKQHQTYRDACDKDNDKTMQDGLVIARYSRHALIEDQKGHRSRCAIRPHIDSLVTGDRVVWQAENRSEGVILSVYPRHSVLGRPDAHNHIKAIAANITQIMIVVAPAPIISWILLDSYLIMADYLHIPAYIVLNKTDLDIEDIHSELLRHYEPLGYPILLTNHASDRLKSLQKALRNQTSVFVGQSGVGKSSMIAHLLPNEASRIQTAAISELTQLGCHTTSTAFLYHIPSGGALIDSPGIRELSLWSMSQAAISEAYREFKPYLSECKFRNCTHVETPGCAVLNALKNNQISLKRYKNYVKIANLIK